MNTCRDFCLSSGRKLINTMRRIIVEQPKMPVNQVMLAQILICVVTVTAVQASAGARGAGNTTAYIDPGTGSFIIQVLLASLAGGVCIIRIFWNKIKEYVLRLLHKKTGSKKIDGN